MVYELQALKVKFLSGTAAGHAQFCIGAQEYRGLGKKEKKGRVGV